MKTTPLPSVVHATCVTDGELRLEQQIDYQERIQNELGLNIVWCGDCGQLQIQPIGVDEYTCYFCPNTSDISNFPDLFYKEMDYVEFDITF